MPWARLDDTLHGHPKIRKAWRCRPALGLHLLALSHCSSYETDGRVSREFVEDQLPDSGERVPVVDALVGAGLWKEHKDGWEIHDFLKYNPSKADAEARREADRKRKQEGRQGES